MKSSSAHPKSVRSWIGFTIARDWIRQLHGKWFRLSDQQFDGIHYAGMAFFKLMIFVFNLVPYLALHIVGSRIQ